jgi:hypothetical protein
MAGNLMLPECWLLKRICFKIVGKPVVTTAIAWSVMDCLLHYKLAPKYRIFLKRYSY